MAAEESVEREIRSSVFDEPSGKTDVALVVEGRRLHVSKVVLAAASNVFDKMFDGDFKEQKREVLLPGKRYADIVDMLLCIYPSELRPVTKATVDKMLELADEYQIESLKRRCEEFLLTVCRNSETPHGDVTYALYLADKYSMPNLLNVTIDIVKKYQFRNKQWLDINAHWLERDQDFVNLGNETKIKLLTEMVIFLQGM